MKKKVAVLIIVGFAFSPMTAIAKRGKGKSKALKK